MKICIFQKTDVTLHSQTGDKISQNDGSLAQLNRASDYGSEGYRFESCRSHKTGGSPHGFLLVFSYIFSYIIMIYQPVWL